jgi:hypothetical protein
MEPAAARPIGHAGVLAVNTLAPYILTALIHRPARLVYLSSGLHRGGEGSLRDLDWAKRTWDPAKAYAESKLQVVALAFVVARLWPQALSNAVDPGWVRTKMGGSAAPVDLDTGQRTQTWLGNGQRSLLAPPAAGGAGRRGQRSRIPGPAHHQITRAHGCGTSCGLVQDTSSGKRHSGFIRYHRTTERDQSAIIFPPMNIQYDPEREALAVMKLDAEAHGADRLRWINAALAWIQLTRLRAPARDRVNGGALASARVRAKRRAWPPTRSASRCSCPI